MGTHYAKKSTKEKEPKQKLPKKKHRLKPLGIISIVLLILAALSAIGYGGYYYYKQTQKVAARQIEIQFEKESLALAKSTRIAAEKEAARIEAERIEAERIAAIKAEEKRIEDERIAAEQAEQARIAAEKKKKQEAELRKKLAEDKARADAARKEALAKEQAIAAEEKARLAAEKTERARLSNVIKQQEQRLAAEQAEYDMLMPAPIVDIPVLTLFQNPELPNGCEITSVGIVLNYIGVYVDKTLLSDMFLPQIPFKDVDGKRVGGDPNIVYCGNPRYKSGGYYCFVNPLIGATNKLIDYIGGDFTPKDITGSDENAIIAQLDSGNPVIAFTTLSMGEPITYNKSQWIIEGTNSVHVPYLNLHCVVLHGYDENFIYIADPMKGNIKCKRSSFFTSYYQMGSRAMIIS